jgi:hypothetical protein
MTCILINVFRPQKALKKTVIKLHNTLGLPVLLYGSLLFVCSETGKVVVKAFANTRK